MTVKKLLLNCLTVLIIAAVTFFIHFLINSYVLKLTDLNELIYSYSINILLACSVIVLLFVLKEKLKNQLGFIFMGTSLLKFALFFLLFYPNYNNDGDLSRIEFLTFFVPYVICLITECVILSKFLNALDGYK